MIQPITQDQFKQYFTPTRGPRGSLLERIQQKSMETRWYRDNETQRVGVIIYDVLDNDWQAVTLEDYGLGYTTHEVRASLSTEKAAVDVLMVLFRCETRETAKLLGRMNRRSLAHSGRSVADILLVVPPVID